MRWNMEAMMVEKETSAQAAEPIWRKALNKMKA
jgi:hypothetical protein